MRIFVSITLAVGLLLGQAAPLWAQFREEDTVEASTQVLREIMSIPGRGIPEAILNDAQGVAIIPGLIKGGFIVGVKHGEGVLVTRDDSGAWRAPLFISATGGSIGWQAGLQSTDVVLVFRTRTSIAAACRGKITIGADASVAAGPIGRDASAATDVQLRSEILSYSRSRGLFAGVAIDGAVLQVEQRAGAIYYAPRPGQPNQLPPSSIRLLDQVVAATGHRPPVALIQQQPAFVVAPPTVAISERDALRRELSDSAARMFAVIDGQWRQYLSLPREIFTEDHGPAAAEQMRETLARYGAVAADPRYRALVDRREFAQTYSTLQRLATLPGSPEVMALPPPPR